MKEKKKKRDRRRKQQLKDQRSSAPGGAAHAMKAAAAIAEPITLTRAKMIIDSGASSTIVTGVIPLTNGVIVPNQTGSEVSDK